eukprot:TRINITY_DN6921_c0_g1_i5.p1 TRINITY_DN6921_c0_g1~~TRINITY_DN6921_c0_g1_i5.p1  ORF type:complete len:255 (-),score=37.65 TRINITY_DN6921_c0_g1_i5:281-1045(-)
MAQFISKNNEEFIRKSLDEGLRLDGRGLLDGRIIQIVFGDKLGQVEVCLGKTRIYANITSNLVEPNPSRPNEGFMKFGVDLSVLSNDEQALSQHRMHRYSAEISKVLENIIKATKVVDAESLVVQANKLVWSIYVQLSVVNNDGNLIDALYLAAILALLSHKTPIVTSEGGDRFSVKPDTTKYPLSVAHIPIAMTFAFFNEGETIIFDPTREEEEIMDGRITVAMNIYRDLCYLQKPGGAPLSADVILRLFFSF